MYKNFLQWAAALGALAVALGAFGAHSLKLYVPVETISTFETGVRYHFYHVFALLLAGVLWERFPGKWMLYAGYCFLIGILLFSGSLYLLTFLKATNTIGLTGVGIITPFGGVFFIGGWICLLLGIRYKAL
jgi:uncharacterized membrane protein YgdD (TMEM256/DUF423 family)